jgi:hypothetical protein
MKPEAKRGALWGGSSDDDQAEPLLIHFSGLLLDLGDNAATC